MQKPTPAEAQYWLIVVEHRHAIYRMMYYLKNIPIFKVEILKSMMIWYTVRQREEMNWQKWYNNIRISNNTKNNCIILK